MEPIYIPHLTKAPNQTQVIQVEEFLPGLETLTPVRGQLRVSHHGNYLQVAAKVEAIATLTCHRCLQQYNHRLLVNTSEMIWLDETANYPDAEPAEQEVPLEDLVETLPPQGYFDPTEWLYQQMSLAIPPRQLCDRDCKGIQLENSNQSQPTVDQRWASLEAFKGKLL